MLVVQLLLKDSLEIAVEAITAMQQVGHAKATTIWLGGKAYLHKTPYTTRLEVHDHSRAIA